MSAEIINVGSELLSGETINTNAAYLAKKLQELGIDLQYQTSVADDSIKLKRVFNQALARSSIIIITGGLGPTKDDITKTVIADALNRKIVSHKPTLLKLQKKLQKLTSKISKIDDRVALYPEEAEILDNPVGNAPGLLIYEGDKTIILLPGVPRELKAIMDKSAVSYLTKHKEKNYVIKQQILKVWGLLEAKVAEIIEDLMGENKNPLIGLRISPEGIMVSITSKGGSPAVAQKRIEEAESEIKKRLGDNVYATGEASMEKIVGMLLSLNKKTIAVAESITGGLIAKKLTDIPGSSNYFLSGMITYSNESKIRDLKIPKELIKENGAVSEKICKAMALAIRKISSADIGLATTGIAGPSGGTKDKPVGLSFIGIADKKNCKVEKFSFSGTREVIRLKTALTALDMVRKYLIE